MKKITYRLDDISSVAKQLQEQLDNYRIITFTGPLGAGKTTLVKELLKQSGVADVVTSPTFTYLNIYENKKGQRFYHFDLYRIETLDQFLEAGFDEYLNQPQSLVLIEWPEPILPLLKEGACHIKIEYAGDGRTLTLS
jgi:tRNA threonylcarbamoyladenosine biosynthesis protein TsaE